MEANMQRKTPVKYGELAEASNRDSPYRRRNFTKTTIGFDAVIVVDVGIRHR